MARDRRFVNEELTNSLMPMVDPLVIASPSRHKLAIHSFKVYVAILHHSTSCTDTGSGVWSTGPTVDELAIAAVSTYATVALAGISIDSK